MNARIKRVRHALEYAGVRLALRLASLLPLRAACAVGASIGWLAYVVFGVRRRVSTENVQRALGETPSSGTPSSIARRSYANLGRSLMEYSAFARLSHEEIRALAPIEGLEHFDHALEKGKGAILFTGHFGNWELMGASAVAHGYPINFLVGEQTNHRVDDLMNELRRKQGIGIISRHVALKKVLRALKDNQMVALLADQDARKAGVFVDFLGAPASTARGPAMFAIKQGCPIISGFIHRTPAGSHVGTLYPPLYADASLEGEDAVRDLTQRFTDQLADAIRGWPAEYFWAHRRWKTKPPA
jgi:KDO2-lipid IV(A) lauroyltransferase